MSPTAQPASRVRRVLTLALPIIGGMVSQNVMNLVDTGMVGVLGDAALAAIGLAGFVGFASAAFIMGLSSGVQTIAARRVGEGRDSEVAIPLNGGLLLAVVIALPWTALLVYAAPHFFPLLIEDPEVVDLAVPYFQIRTVGLMGLGMNFAFRGYWNAISRAVLYMRTLVFMHLINIFLNWVFIFGNLGAPELGATGAGLATMIATYCGAAYYCWLGWREAREAGFLRSLPASSTLAGILRLCVPTGIQNTFFAGGLLTFSVIVGMVGTAELAANQVIVNILLVGILPGVGFGLAGATLVSQSLGREEPAEAKRWGWDVAVIGGVAITVVALPGIFIPEVLLGVFIHTEETLALAVSPLRVVAYGIPFDVIGVILMHAMIGAGATRASAVVSILMQWCLFLPAAYLIGPVMGLGLTEIWMANMAYRFLQTLVFTGLWRRGDWAKIKV